MPSTDTAADDTTLSNPGQDDAELGAQPGQQPSREQPETRQPKQGDQPKPGGDDPVAENDPLVLARKGALNDAKPASAKPAPAKPKPAGAGKDGEQATQATEEQPTGDGERAAETEEQPEEQPDAKAKPATEEDDPLLTAKLSDEAWGKLTHKDKSTFLSVQKAARIKAEEARKARAEAAKHKTDYDTVERFVKDSGLDPDSYRNSVLIAGMVARGDARALPVLEESVKRLRQAAGIQEPAAQAAPAVDPDELLAAIEEAETSLDFDKAKQLVAKLKQAKPAAPQAPAGGQRQPAAQPNGGAPAAAPTGIDQSEAAVNESVADYLVENGVKPDQVVPYLQQLITANPALAQAPVRERLRAVMRAHSAARAKAQHPAKPQQQPISGRGRSAGGGRSADPNEQDPLVLARRGKWRP